MSGGINLGDVTFALNGDTQGLDRALQKLSQFSQYINNLEASKQKGIEGTIKAYVRQEKAVSDVFLRLQSLNRAIRETGAPSHMLAAGTNAFQAYTRAMTQGELSAKEFSRAQVYAKARLSDLSNELKEYQAQARSAAKASDIMFAAQNRADRIQGVQGARIARLVSTANRFSVSGASDFSANASGILGSYTSAVRSGDSASAKASLISLNTELRNFQDKIDIARDRSLALSGAFRNMERATVLAVGPLSGLGSRMAVLSAILESGTVKTALFIASLSAVGAASVFAGAAAVKSAMDFEKWEAMMTAATGTTLTVKDEMKYLIDYSQKMGQSISATIPEYAKFATSARLSGLAVAEQHKTFEAFITAGAALRWNTDQIGRAFLALEQIMSKGTVQTQEIKLQLGQVLPGAFELAAVAVGKTQAEFSKMLQKGELISRDFMPKFAELVQKTYEMSAKLGQSSTQAELNRFSNNLTLLSKSFNDSIGAASSFASMLKNVNSVLEWSTGNMDKAVAALGGIVTAFTVMSLPGLFRGMLALAEGIKAVTAAIWGLNAAAIAGPGGIIFLLIRMAAAVGIGYGAYKMLEGQLKDTGQEIRRFNKDLEENVAFFQKMGTIPSQVKSDIISKTREQIALLEKQNAAEESTLQKALEREKKLNDPARQRAWASGGRIAPLNAGAAAIQEQMKMRQDAIDSMKRSLEELDKVQVADPKNDPLTDKLKGRSIDAFVSKLKDAIDRVKELKAIGLNLASGVPEDNPTAKALLEVDKFLNHLDKVKGQDALTAILKSANYEGKTLRDQLTALYTAMEEQEAKNKELSKAIDARKNAQEDINRLQAQYDALVSSGTLMEGSRAKAVFDFRAALEAAKVDQETINNLTERYAAIRKQVDDKKEAIETQKKEAAEYGKIIKLIARKKTAEEEINAVYDERISVVQRNAANEQTAIQQITTLEKMRHKDLWQHYMDTNEWIKSFMNMSQTAGDALAQFMYDAFTGAESAGVNLFQTLTKELLNFVNKALIIKPIMTALFGDMYTGGSSGGLGLLGSLVMQGVGALGLPGATPPVSTYPAFSTNIVAHGGGRAGSVTTSRMLPDVPAAFLPKFHSGLMSDEVRAVLRKDETVLTPAQLNSLAGGHKSLEMHIHVTAEKGATQEDGENLGRGMQNQMEGFLNAWAARQKLPGGVLYG